jgi:Tfp pilus assembly protein PilO
VALRAVLLFLLVMGMSYRIYLMEQGGEKENLKNKVRELEDKLRQLEMESE